MPDLYISLFNMEIFLTLIYLPVFHKQIRSRIIGMTYSGHPNKLNSTVVPAMSMSLIFFASVHVSG